MRIAYVSVKNYRNIDGIEVFFDPDCNYIIGENNIGKSNFLALLTTITNGRSFTDDDFENPENPIEVEFHLTLLEQEYGFLGDVFSPEDSSIVKLRYYQEITDASPSVLCIDTNESLNTRKLKKINFLKYETTSLPSRELRLDSQKGTGLVVSRIIEQFANGNSSGYLNDVQISKLMDFINDHLSRLRGFRDYDIKATIAADPVDMLTGLFYLSDGNRKIDSTGSGIQYMAMASINVLSQIMELFNNKSTPFEQLLYTGDSGKRFLPLVLAIDEPEVHLHPYLQRSLLGNYKRILRNEDPDFVELLKICFDIDGLDGQLIVVTHSTDALIGDYRNLIRFYRMGGKCSVVSGFILQPSQSATNKGKLTIENEKHLLMHFPEIKEAFYSKCALIIEGETEYGCMQSFGNKIGISLDDNGICVINARGEESIKPIRELLCLFKIPSVALYDGDVKSKSNLFSDAFFTNEICFEAEIVRTLLNNCKQDLVRKIAFERDQNYEKAIMDQDMVRRPFVKMGEDLVTYIPKRLADVDDNDQVDFFRMFTTWFIVKKGIILGRIIGELLPAELVPACYTNAILRAKEVANNE